jgi:uncharacterized membrane protein
LRINPAVSEWINLAARWAHIFSAILWVGTTYFFTWLDGRFHEQAGGETDDEAGQVWMVHSGGFYVVSKQGLERLPRVLHWFRYEAAFTWLTGMVLLVVVYYLGGALIDPDIRDQTIEWYNALWGGRFKSYFNLSAHYEIFIVALSLLFLVVSWVVYDLLVQSPLGRNEKAFAAVAFALTVALAYALTRVFSGRAAYIHLGAIYGTLMFANVWMRILPAQRRMVAALKAGEKPDMSWAARAKLRSKQNTFMVVPVVFTMISHHFASTYGHEYNWAILSALVLVGWVAASIIRRA